MNLRTAQHSPFKNSRLLPYVICGLASCFYVYAYLLQVLPSTITHSLMASFQIQAGGLGLLSALFFYGYASMQIPAGMLFDQYGTRLLLTFTVLICSVSVAAFATSDSFPLALLFRFITGFTAAFSFTGALIVGALWFPPRYFALYTGVMQSLGALGAIIAGAPLAALVTHYGWHHTLTYLAMIGLLLALAIWLIVCEKLPDIDSKQEPRTKKKMLRNLSQILKNHQTWMIGLFAFSTWAPVTIFPVLWGIPFLQTVYHMSKVHAATSIAILWIGSAFGPLVGWWSNRISQRRLPMIFISIIGILATAALIFIEPLPLMLVYLLLFLFGIGTAGQVLSFGLVSDIYPKERIGTAIGFTNTAVVAGGMIFQPFIGYLLELLWNGKHIHGIPIYSIHAYQVALSILPLCFVIALITAIFWIKETNCCRKDEIG